jgi:hypothetical protein
LLLWSWNVEKWDPASESAARCSIRRRPFLDRQAPQAGSMCCLGDDAPTKWISSESATRCNTKRLPFLDCDAPQSGFSCLRWQRSPATVTMHLDSPGTNGRVPTPWWDTPVVLARGAFLASLWPPQGVDPGEGGLQGAQSLHFANGFHPLCCANAEQVGVRQWGLFEEARTVRSAALATARSFVGGM